MDPASRPRRVAIATGTSTVSAAAPRPTKAPPIRMHTFIKKRPGREARLCFMGHALMENRNGLVVDACLTRADGHAERVAALRSGCVGRDAAAAVRIDTPIRLCGLQLPRSA